MNDYEMVTLLCIRAWMKSGVEKLTSWRCRRALTDAGGEITAVVPWGRRILDST